MRQYVGMVLILFATVLLTSCGGNEGTKTSSDQPTGSVVLYCSVDQEYAEAIIAAFHEKYPGINVRSRFDTEATKTTGLVERLRSEKANPQADLFWSSEVFLTIRLADEGLLKSYESEALAGWPESFCDSEGRWYGFAARGRVIAYNPKRVTDPPMNWRDLADPKYQNRICMADPNFGTTRGHVSAWYALWGSNDAETFLNQLKENKMRIVRSNSQTVREVVAGTSDFALTDTDDVWAAIRNGHNLALVYPRHHAGEVEGGGTLLIPNTLSFIAGRPESEAVKMLAEFLLSPEVEALLYATDSHNVPIHAPQVELKSEHVIPDPLQVNYADVSAAMDEAMEAANRILLGG